MNFESRFLSTQINAHTHQQDADTKQTFIAIFSIRNTNIESIPFIEHRILGQPAEMGNMQRNRITSPTCFSSLKPIRCSSARVLFEYPFAIEMEVVISQTNSHTLTWVRFIISYMEEISMHVPTIPKFGSWQTFNAFPMISGS